MKCLDDKLNVNVLSEIVGGKDNIYAFGAIRGFRKGDENGDNPFISNSLGSFGNKNFLGPINYIRSKTGMNQAEFFATWLVGVL